MFQSILGVAEGFDAPCALLVALLPYCAVAEKRRAFLVPVEVPNLGVSLKRRRYRSEGVHFLCRWWARAILGGGGRPLERR